jgi:hypothetical protein
MPLQIAFKKQIESSEKVQIIATTTGIPTNNGNNVTFSALTPFS